jgi:hypothetical protein
MWIANTTTGEAVRGCCRATNLCECARHRFMRETTRMLALDAIENAPTIFAVLTAREFLVKDDALKRVFADKLLRPLRRHWPVEWFLRWERQRRGRLHVNQLVKGVPAAEHELFRQELVELWCAAVDAEPQGQYVEPIEDGEAVTLYVAKKIRHTGKSNQEPHFKFKHRTSQTRGYLVRPASVMRAEARRSLRIEALLRSGVDDADLERRLDDEWKLTGGDAALRWADTGRKVLA